MAQLGDQHTLVQLGGAQFGGADRGRVGAVDDVLVDMVFQDPAGVLPTLDLMNEPTDDDRAHAQQPVAIGVLTGLADQQIDQVCRRAVGVVVAVAVQATDQGGDKGIVVGFEQSVGDDSGIATEPGQALQLGHRAAYSGDGFGPLASAGERLGGEQLVEHDLRIERHVQIDVIGQVRTVVDAVLASVGLGTLELVEQLPEQQHQQHQYQERQRALQRAVQRST